jgi:protein-S-isoprenylcysteine O-methyltransferase Ste14
MFPFYIFIFTAIFILEEGLMPSFFKFESYKNIIDFNSNKMILSLFIRIVGAVFCFISISIYIYVNFFEKSFPSCLTLKEEKQLKGIYNYIRHPSYYVYFFITFGTAFYLMNVLLFILACINHISLYFYYMIDEEQAKKNNPYYNEYLKKTNRFLPRFPKSI